MASSHHFGAANGRVAPQRRTFAVGVSGAPAAAMSIVLFLVFGIVAGLIARAIMPGAQSMGIIMTGVLGIVGSFVGGIVGNLVAGRAVTELHTTGIVGSVLGALLVLVIMRVARRSA
jgi:uncharacterized membrane protein YeaQ/YmgE (transglycosylase-associated protein family)